LAPRIEKGRNALEHIGSCECFFKTSSEETHLPLDVFWRITLLEREDVGDLRGGALKARRRYSRCMRHHRPDAVVVMFSMQPLCGTIREKLVEQFIEMEWECSQLRH